MREGVHTRAAECRIVVMGSPGYRRVVQILAYGGVTEGKGE